MGNLRLEQRREGAGAIMSVQKLVHENAVAKGFWNGIDKGDSSVIPKALMLIVSEASEALEAYRNTPVHEEYDLQRELFETDSGCVTEWACSSDGELHKPIGFDSELADIVIRVLDLAEHMGIDLDKSITRKMAFNKTRKPMHGGKRC